MSVAYQLVQKAQDRGIRLVTQGGHLVVDAPKGALTPELREALRAHKSEIMAELRPEPEDRREAHQTQAVIRKYGGGLVQSEGTYESTSHHDAEGIAEMHGLTLADLEQAAGSEWLGINDDPTTLEALARAIQIRRMREHGEIPPHYTATTTCRHCGEVPIFEGAGERVPGCPWCLNRVSGKPIPRPRQCLT
ncbi:MAG: hypothetical protein O7D29_03145 [Gemmatimonadetes bacterium]|nr:hypothetical protein [Gemmatimonadota bacterium]